MQKIMSKYRVALCVRYDGARYHGWQRQDQQDDLLTVQLFVERAVSQVAHQPISTVCAGRTDARVHATGQVVHFDVDVERTEHAWVFGVNSNLPHDISVLWAKIVPNDFHARYSAISRRYRYIIYNYPIRPGILRHAVGWYYKSLDADLMRESAKHLLGEHDFSSFRGSGCQSKSPFRCVNEVLIIQQRDMIIIEIEANAFLMHMVRNIVGVLIQVGSKRQPPEWVQTVLEACDRRAAAQTIAPNGLYLVRVEYPQHYEIQSAPVGPFFLPDLFG
jgi:tRNA pseudouridine38-40 synthase